MLPSNVSPGECISQPYWLMLSPASLPMGQTVQLKGQSVGGCLTVPTLKTGIAHDDACGETGGRGTAHAWTIQPHTADRMITVSTCGETTEDTVTTVREGCSATGFVLACQNDDSTAECGTQSTVTFRAVAGQSYTVFVQTANPATCWTDPALKVSVEGEPLIRPAG